MESFSLTMEGDTVIVRGRKRKDQAVDNLSRRGFWQLLRSYRTAEVDEWESVELRYTPEQLSHMDDEGRSKRGRARRFADHGSFGDLRRRELVGRRRARVGVVLQ